jgi:hypothetical protein
MMVENLERAQEVIVALERENKILRDELAILKQGLFGRRSERLEPGQLALFLAQQGGAAVTPQAHQESTPAPAASRVRASAGHGRTQFPAHLPREVITLDVPEPERTCPDCSKIMQPIGEE